MNLENIHVPLHPLLIKVQAKYELGCNCMFVGGTQAISCILDELGKYSCAMSQHLWSIHVLLHKYS